MYRLLIVDYEAIYVCDSSTSSAGRFYKLSDNMSGLKIVLSFPTMVFYFRFFGLLWV
jgi:hypothetical protein